MQTEVILVKTVFFAILMILLNILEVRVLKRPARWLDRITGIIALTGLYSLVLELACWFMA